MNPRILVLAIVITIFIATASALIHWQPAQQRNQDTVRNESLSLLDESETWRASFEKVDAYRTPLPVVNKQPNKSVEKKRQPQLTDKRLIAIVEDQQKSVVLINARGKNATIQVLKRGDSWLPPWELEAIHSDFVVWSNSDTQQQQQQYLFKR
jgi:hypothetical protein